MAVNTAVVLLFKTKSFKFQKDEADVTNINRTIVSQALLKKSLKVKKTKQRPVFTLSFQHRLFCDYCFFTKKAFLSST